MRRTVLRHRFLWLVAVVAAIAAGAGLLDRNEPAAPPAPPPAAVATVDASPVPGEQPQTVPAPERVVEQAAERTHDELRTEAPSGVPAAQLDAGREQQERLAATDQLPIITPDAAPQQAGCRSRFVSSYSSRRGVRPRLFVLHYTVSPNRPGWQDVDAITVLFARASFAASSHYIIDREGHCAYIVRETDKAWTQAGLNPVSLSVEIINSGREGTLTSGAGRQRLVQVMAAAMRRWKIPAQQARVSGCSVLTPGVIDHAALGACGGGHNDVNPYRGEIPGLIAQVRRKLRPPGPTATDRVTCRKLNSWRNAGRPRGGRWETRSVARKRALAARRIDCTPSGPVRR